MRMALKTIVAAAGSLLVGSTAYAHISVAGPATANSTYEAVFSVGHGCEGGDTLSVEVTIPSGVTSVRPVPGGVFGNPVITKDGTGAVSKVTWTKATSDVLTADEDFYKLTIRMKLPDAAFTTVYFPTKQTCVGPNNTTLVTDWIGTTANESHDSDAGAAPEPAPALFLLPARSNGWNKLTVTQPIKDLSVFNDAQIVWAGNAAYSNNPTTKELLKTEPNTTALTEIAAGTVVWVKY